MELEEGVTKEVNHLECQVIKTTLLLVHSTVENQVVGALAVARHTIATLPTGEAIRIGNLILLYGDTPAITM